MVFKAYKYLNHTWITKLQARNPFHKTLCTSASTKPTLRFYVAEHFMAELLALLRAPHSFRNIWKSGLHA